MSANFPHGYPSNPPHPQQAAHAQGWAPPTNPFPVAGSEGQGYPGPQPWAQPNPAYNAYQAAAPAQPGYGAPPAWGPQPYALQVPAVGPAGVPSGGATYGYGVRPGMPPMVAAPQYSSAHVADPYALFEALKLTWDDDTWGPYREFKLGDEAARQAMLADIYAGNLPVGIILTFREKSRKFDRMMGLKTLGQITGEGTHLPMNTFGKNIQDYLLPIKAEGSDLLSPKMWSVWKAHKEALTDKVVYALATPWAKVLLSKPLDPTSLDEPAALRRFAENLVVVNGQSFHKLAPGPGFQPDPYNNPPVMPVQWESQYASDTGRWSTTLV